MTLVTQHDVKLVHAIEELIGTKIPASDDFDEEAAMRRLNDVTKASRLASINLVDYASQQSSGGRAYGEDHVPSKKRHRRS